MFMLHPLQPSRTLHCCRAEKGRETCLNAISALLRPSTNSPCMRISCCVLVCFTLCFFPSLPYRPPHKVRLCTFCMLCFAVKQFRAWSRILGLRFLGQTRSSISNNQNVIVNSKRILTISRNEADKAFTAQKGAVPFRIMLGLLFFCEVRLQSFIFAFSHLVGNVCDVG